MGRYLGSKHKLCRRAGMKLCGLAKCPLDKKGPVPPGQHGLSRKRALSEYGIQLREKQKMKWSYGIFEKQFRNYFKKAFKRKGNTGEAFFQLLESRLDNIVYRLGLAPTRAASRQLVRHGQILIDGRKVDIPSYQVKPNQTVSLRPKALKIPAVKKVLEERKTDIPSWLQKKATAGKMLRLPNRDEVGAGINEQLVVEYYSRQL